LPSAPPHVEQLAEVLSKSLLSQGMVGAMRSLRALRGVDRLSLGDASLLSTSPDSVSGAASSTPRDDAAADPGHPPPRVGRNAFLFFKFEFFQWER
jgi:hypothetical protein